MTAEEQPRIWRSSWTGSGIEVNLGGDAQGIDQSNLELSSRCESHIEQLKSESLKYLAEHLKDSSRVVGELEIEWVDVGLSNYGQHREFEICFSDDSTYVLWVVRFRYSPLTAEPEFRF